MRPEHKKQTAILLFALLAAAAGCSKQKAAAPEKPPVPVAVATVAQRPVPVELAAIGNVEAYSTVDIKARINGQVFSVHFQEGQDVKQGQLLFTIDPRPFQVALAQAEASLAKDSAQLETAKIQQRRYERLFEEGVVSSEQNDQVRTNAEALEALVKADKAAIEAAKLDLAYCSISSPIDGRTGNLMVHAGNLVKANDVPVLVTILQVNPIYVTFSLPEKELPETKARMAEGKVRVEATPPKASGNPEEGVLTFVDNTVNTTTGTIKLKATFANAARRLWPGLFVNVVVKLSVQPNAIVVPAQAVQAGQSGSYVFVVRPNRTAEVRPVVVARTVGGDAVIEKGLAPGELVVTDGQIRLVTGTKVEFKEARSGS